MTTEADRLLGRWLERVEPRMEPPGLLDHVFTVTAFTPQRGRPWRDRLRAAWASVDIPAAWSGRGGRLATVAIVVIGAVSVVGLTTEVARMLTAPSATALPQAASAIPAASARGSIAPGTGFGRTVAPVATIQTGAPPTPGLVVGTDEAVWYASGQYLVRIDAVTNVVTSTEIPGASEILGLDVDSDTVYVLTSGGVTRVDRTAGDPPRLMPLDFRACCGLAIVGETLWIGSEAGMHIVDAASGGALASLPTPDRELGQTGFPAFGDLWVWDGPRSRVTRVDPDGARITEVPVTPALLGAPCDPTPIRELDGIDDQVIVPCLLAEDGVFDRYIMRIDPRTNATLTPLDVGGDWWTQTVIAGGWWFWRLDVDEAGYEATSGRLSRIDPGTRQVVDAVELDGSITRPWFVAAGDSVWMLQGSRVLRLPVAAFRAP